MLDLQIIPHDRNFENCPIRVEDFISLIDTGDKVYYCRRNEDLYVLSEVLGRLDLGNFEVRLLSDYKGTFTIFSKGDQINASPSEVYWPVEVDLPGKRLERLVRQPQNL